MSCIYTANPVLYDIGAGMAHGHTKVSNNRFRWGSVTPSPTNQIEKLTDRLPTKQLNIWNYTFNGNFSSLSLVMLLSRWHGKTDEGIGQCQLWSLKSHKQHRGTLVNWGKPSPTRARDCSLHKRKSTTRAATLSAYDKIKSNNRKWNKSITLYLLGDFSVCFLKQQTRQWKKLQAIATFSWLIALALQR